jgi:hypothetical protein|tara:strand:- start:7932 stop:8102 length:171 start_codon:yes stop_codon:yes gene_type:complete
MTIEVNKEGKVVVGIKKYMFKPDVKESSFTINHQQAKQEADKQMNIKKLAKERLYI